MSISTYMLRRTVISHYHLQRTVGISKGAKTLTQRKNVYPMFYLLFEDRRVQFSTGIIRVSVASPAEINHQDISRRHVTTHASIGPRLMLNERRRRPYDS